MKVEELIEELKAFHTGYDVFLQYSNYYPSERIKSVKFNMLMNSIIISLCDDPEEE